MTPATRQQPWRLRPRQMMGTISGLVAVLLLLTVASAQTLPRCPQFPDDVSVSSSSDLMKLLSQISYPYFSPPTGADRCEVRAMLSSGTYRMTNPIKLSNITLVLYNQNVRGRQQVCGNSPPAADVTIAAPPNSRAFMLRGNLTTFRALAITFVGGDLSSSAQFFASNKGLQHWGSRTGLDRAMKSSSELASQGLNNNPIFKDEGTSGTNPLYNPSYRGSNYGAIGDDPRFRLDASACSSSSSSCDRTGSSSSPISLMPDDDCDGYQDRAVRIDKGFDRDYNGGAVCGTTSHFRAAQGASPGRYSSSLSSVDACSSSSVIRLRDQYGNALSASSSRLTGGSSGAACAAGISVDEPGVNRARTPATRGASDISVDAWALPSSTVRATGGDLDGDGVPDVVYSQGITAGREAGSGLATGRRCTCPSGVCVTDNDYPPVGLHEVRTPREAGSGLATGRRAYFINGLSAPTDATNSLRKSGSIIYLDREGNEVLRGPLVGGDPSDLIDLGDAAGSAGGLFSVRGGSALFEGCSFLQSSALLGGAIHVTKGGFVRLGCSSVSQCTAQEDGGGIYADDNSLVVLNGSSLSLNFADNGGAVSVTENARLLSFNSSFLQNSAARCGGGISVDETGISYTESSVFLSNKADKGGAVCVGSLSISDFGMSRFVSNSALHGGGAVFAEPTTIVRFSRTFFNQSSAFIGRDVLSYGRVPFSTTFDPPPIIEGAAYQGVSVALGSAPPGTLPTVPALVRPRRNLLIHGDEEEQA